MSYKYTKVGNSGTVRTNTTLLDALKNGIQQKLATRVGILGNSGRNRVVQHPSETSVAFKKRVKAFLKSDKSQGDAPTNADIGLAHEKGVKTKNLPRRSWLEEPLQDKLRLHMQKLGEQAIEKMLNSQYEQAYAELGVIAEIIIQKGFETGGYGKWPKLKQSTIAAKGSSAILIDTAQLRRSITSEVVHK